MWLNEEDANMARYFNALFDLLEYIIHELLLEDIINESFQNQSVDRKPTTKEAMESLKCYKCNTDEETCCICQLEIDNGDEIIELPCGHKFHGNDCDCPGIMPWLKDNNTCPLCKHELPFSETDQESDNNESDNMIPMLEEEVYNIVNNVVIKIMNGDVPDIIDIRSSNVELVDRIRRSLHN